MLRAPWVYSASRSSIQRASWRVDTRGLRLWLSLSNARVDLVRAGVDVALRVGPAPRHVAPRGPHRHRAGVFSSTSFRKACGDGS